jgi:hypothetical protein
MIWSRLGERDPRKSRRSRGSLGLPSSLDELRRIGFSDIQKAVKWHGTLIQESGELDSDTAAAIAEISSNPTGGLRIKFHNKKEALVALAALKHAAAEETPADQRAAATEVPRRGLAALLPVRRSA